MSYDMYNTILKVFVKMWQKEPCAKFGRDKRV